MQKVSRQIFSELIWLTTSFGVTILLLLALFGRGLLSDTIEIRLQDTYFVIEPTHVLLPAFFLMTFFIYFIKELRKSFHRTLPNWILIISGLALVLSLTFLIKIFSGFQMNVRWTLYLPLSALGPDKIPELPQEPITEFLTNSLAFLQVVILIMWTYAIFRRGRHKSIKKQT